MNATKLRHMPVEETSVPEMKAMPDGEGDFLPELHASRVTLGKPSLFREEMSKKTSNTADARQKRGR
jgi:hypothetical protein